jgi:hypothetical protein
LRHGRNRREASSTALSTALRLSTRDATRWGTAPPKRLIIGGDSPSSRTGFSASSCPRIGFRQAARRGRALTRLAAPQPRAVSRREEADWGLHRRAMFGSAHLPSFRAKKILLRAADWSLATIAAFNNSAERHNGKPARQCQIQGDGLRGDCQCRVPASHRRVEVERASRHHIAGAANRARAALPGIRAVGILRWPGATRRR